MFAKIPCVVQCFSRHSFPWIIWKKKACRIGIYCDACNHLSPSWWAVEMLTTVPPLLLWLAGQCRRSWPTALEVPPSRSPRPLCTSPEPKDSQRVSMRRHHRVLLCDIPPNLGSPASSLLHPQGQSSWAPRYWSSRRSPLRRPPRETPCSSLEVGGHRHDREEKKNWSGIMRGADKTLEEM